jgi:hypothetical protein
MIGEMENVGCHCTYMMRLLVKVMCIDNWERRENGEERNNENKVQVLTSY